ncbi:MAG: dihydrofolate reductase family protein [Bdellovibrionales bacterium]|nr:dihydrofolate reductase family protein [Bdellovibrionales bacterium]
MFIFSNLATSLDGKIASADRGHFYLGTPADRRQMQVLRKRADAILVGASTLRSFRRPMLVAGSKRLPVNVIVSSRLEGLSPEWAFFKRRDLPRILVTTARAPLARRKKFAKFAEIVLIDPKRPAAPQIVQALAKRGIRKLLVEGGGGTMWDFVKAGLLDEIHVTLTPWILGGATAPTLVDGEGFPATRAQRLRIARVRRVKEELFLTYRRV